MTVLTDIRTSLTEALEAAGVAAFDHLPERLNPPAAVVLPGSPYLQAGDTFGTHKVNFTVSLVAGNGTNEAATANLDGLIEKAILALWDVADVATASEVYAYTANTGTYLATDLTVTDIITFK